MQILRKLLQTSIATGFTVISLLLLFVFSDISIAQTSTGPKVLRYQYDALGRLTFTEDTVNGNRDFDYDAAGNRLLVTTATPNDQTAEPGGPPPPTGLTLAGPFSQGGGYTASWVGSVGASYYEVLLSTGNILNLGTTSISNQYRPSWVKACNAITCSSKVYF
jgi:YD repeat-containing protein